MTKSTAVTITATGTPVSEPCVVKALGIKGGADAATVVFRDGGALGPVRWSLGVAANTSDGVSFSEGIRFENSCYATVTGTAPNVHVAVEMPRSKQVNPV